MSFHVAYDKETRGDQCKDQPLYCDASYSPITGYISFDDDNDDDDVEKDEEDKEEEEHLALADPSAVPTDDPETMTTVDQGMSIEEIERVVAQPEVANTIELSMHVGIKKALLQDDCTRAESNRNINQTRGTEQKYMEKEFSIFLAYVTAKEVEDKSEKEGLGRASSFVLDNEYSNRSGTNGAPACPSTGTCIYYSSSEMKELSEQRLYLSWGLGQGFIRTQSLHPGSVAGLVLVSKEGWIILTEVGEAQILDPELIQETTEKIVQIKQRMQAAHDWQKSYADLKRKPMEFQVVE
ncbi:hypothetical protein Tco_0940321 [Tanacetum coccineum]|uniref:Uncharacterized protein n=1 Tax=Tanacetum coccineum TaxID=301880 RepID=A0ABQ5DQC5_9ASTR